MTSAQQDHRYQDHRQQDIRVPRGTEQPSGQASGRAYSGRSRIGVIGIGRIGTMHARHLQELTSDPVELILADEDPQRADELGHQLGAQAVTAPQQLFDLAPDGIVIAVGTSHHAQLIEQAAEAGIPVFCEKPLAESTQAALPVLETIRRTGAIVQIGHQRRLDAGYLEARRALRAGELGWLHTLRAITCDMFPPSVRFLAESGGIFRDCSVHDFDILQWLTGRPIVEVFARGSNHGDPAIGQIGDVDSATALITFDDDTVATVSATRYNGAGHDVRLELHGSQDTLQVGLDNSYAGRSAELDVEFPLGTRHQTFHERFLAAYRAEMRAFVRLVQGEGENPCTAAESVDASRVADAAQLSLETAQAQRVLR